MSEPAYFNEVREVFDRAFMSRQDGGDAIKAGFALDAVMGLIRSHALDEAAEVCAKGHPGSACSACAYQIRALKTM